MLYSIHEDDRTFQPEQDPIVPHSQAILVFARGEFPDVTGEAGLQGIESLANIPPQRFGYQRTSTSLYRRNFSSQVTTGIFSQMAWAMIWRSKGSGCWSGKSKRRNA